MKKGSVAVFAGCFFAFTMVSAVCAFDIPGMAKTESKAAVDVDGLSKRSVTLFRNLNSATLAFAEGVVKIQAAVGHKEQAAKLQQAIDNARAKKDDQNATKALVKEVNNSTADLEKVDLQSSLDKSKASELIGASLLNVGAGILLDTIAVNDATNLLKESQAALKQVSWGAAGKVKDVINVSQFVVQEVPPQAKNLGSYSSKLTSYAKANGIQTPSKEDTEKKLKDLQEG